MLQTQFFIQYSSGHVMLDTVSSVVSNVSGLTFFTLPFSHLMRLQTVKISSNIEQMISEKHQTNFILVMNDEHQLFYQS